MDNIIKNILNDRYEVYDFRTKINMFDKEYLLYLFNNKQFINNIDVFLENIFKNDKIEFHDIPDVVLFICKLCIENKNNYNINIINITKIIMEIIIYITIDKDNEDKEIIYNIIDTSINLLNINPKKYFFCKIFNWCK